MSKYSHNKFVILCHRGIRSYSFARWLLENELVKEVWNLDEGIDELKRKIRSTSMPGFEPPFFMFDNKKFYITSKIKYE